MKQVLAVLIVLIAMVPVAIAAGTGISDTSPDSPEIGDGAKYRVLSSGFIPNVGQYDPGVEYILQHQGSTVFFTRGGFVLAHTPGSAGNASRDVIRQSFAGISFDTHLATGSQRTGVVNYYVGNDSSKWLSGIPVYSEVIYKDLYPGIDLVYAERDGRLKREFHVSPGADPLQIELLYEGESEPYVDGDGVLRFASPAGEMLESPLVCWQVIDDERINRAAEYVVDCGSVRIDVTGYDAEYELIIDPELVYASYLGGDKPDIGYALASDGAGGVWVTGNTWSSNFPISNEFQSNYGGGGGDVFVSHFSSSGDLLSSTYLGGEGTDTGYALVGDGDGGVWVTGVTSSTNFPVQGAYQNNYGGGDGDFGDAFITHFSSSGDLLSSTYLGGGGKDRGVDLVGDGSGGVWVTGETSSTNFPVQSAHQGNYGGGDEDAFVAHFSSDGDLISSTYLGGGDTDYGTALAGDITGGVWVTGITSSTNFPVKNAYQNSYGGGGPDAFIAHFSSSGTLQSSTYLGGWGNDYGNALVDDGAGGVWVTGSTSSTNFPVQGIYQKSHGGGPDAFVSHFSPTGDLFSSTCLGGADYEHPYALVGDDAGGVWVTGTTSSADFPVKKAYQSNRSSYGGGWYEAFVARISSSGDLLSSTYLGGGGDEHGRALASDGDGGVWVTGTTKSTNFPIQDAYQEEYGGNIDAFVSYFSPSGDLYLSTYLGGSKGDSGTALVGDGSGGVWVLGSTTSTDFPVKRAYQNDYGGGYGEDLFIARFGSSDPVYPPTANFTADTTTGPAPLTVRFTDLSTGSPNEWFWDFGDSATSTDQSPTHTYTAPGNYTVALTVSDGNTNDTMTKEHYIRVQPALPRAELIFNVNCNRYAQSDCISSGTTLCRLVYITGAYNLPENLENISGNLSITLDAPEIVNIGPEEYAEINGTEVTWTFPGGFISPGTTLSTRAATSTLVTRRSDVTLERSCNRTIFTEAGVQQVTLNMTLDTIDLDRLWGRIECFDTGDVQARVIPDTISTNLPVSDLSQESATRIQFTADRLNLEAGRQYTLSCAVEVTPLRPVTYAPACTVWEVRDSESMAAPAGAQVALPAGLLPQNVTSVEFSSDTSCEWMCAHNDHLVTSIHQWADTVSPPPAANFTANTTTGVAPLAVRFTDTSTGNPTAWNWFFGDGATSTGQNPSHTYSDAGVYTVRLTASNAYGEDTSTRTDYITVLEPPAVSFTADPTEGNAPLTVRFTDESAGNVTSWAWDFGDGNTSIEQNPAHTYGSAGRYTVTLNASNAYGYSMSSPATITVLEPLAVNFTANVTAGPAPLTVRFTDLSTGDPTNWFWFFGDGNTSADQSPTHTYTAPGNYTVNLTVNSRAGSDTLSRPGYITVTTSVQNTLSFDPPSSEVQIGGATGYNVVLDTVPAGLSGFNISVALTNPSVGEIIDLSYPAWAMMPKNSSLPADSVSVQAVDLEQLVGANATNVTLCILTIRGDTVGTTNLTITPIKVDDDLGGRYAPVVIGATLTVQNILPFPNPLGGDFPTPGDLDGDGLYEDLDGNGLIGFNDVVIYYQNMDFIETNQPLAAFDYDGSGFIGFNDVVWLYERV